MEFEFEEQNRTASKLSVAVYGPSGSGKTCAMFKIAMGIRDQLYPGEKLKDIALFIDTERRSSTKAVGRNVGGEALEPFELYAFEPPFDIIRLSKLVEYAINIKHKKIIVIDSYTAFWSGMEGILDRVANLDVELGASKKLYGAWSEKEIVTKKNILKNLMTNSEAHMIIGFRAKTEYVLEVNSRGKTTPKAIGLKEDMQQDVRFEFDVVISLDKDTHEAEVVKDRIGYLEFKQTSENPNSPITIQDGRDLARIVSEGVSSEEVMKRKLNTYINFILDEKAHKSSKVQSFEKAKNVTITKEYLDTLDYDKLQKLVNYFKD